MSKLVLGKRFFTFLPGSVYSRDELLQLSTKTTQVTGAMQSSRRADSLTWWSAYLSNYNHIYILCYLHRRESGQTAFKIIWILPITSWFDFDLSVIEGWRISKTSIPHCFFTLYNFPFSSQETRVNSFFGQSQQEVLLNDLIEKYSSSFPVQQTVTSENWNSFEFVTNLVFEYLGFTYIYLRNA